MEKRYPWVGPTFVAALALVASGSLAKEGAPAAAVTTARAVLKTPAPPLRLEAPDLGRGYKAELEERIRTKREQIKERQARIAAWKAEAPSPESSAHVQKAEQSIATATQSLEKAKQQLSKEKRHFSKQRNEARETAKKWWGKSYGAANALEEISKHARRKALLERIHHVAVMEKMYELAGRAAVALAAEDYRHEEMHRLILEGVKLPPAVTPSVPSAGGAGPEGSAGSAGAGSAEDAPKKDKARGKPPAKASTGAKATGAGPAPMAAPAKEGAK